MTGPDYLILSGRTMCPPAAPTEPPRPFEYRTHEDAAAYVRRAYGLELPVLVPGGSWRSHDASGMGIIVNRAACGVAPTLTPHGDFLRRWHGGQTGWRA